MRLGHWYVLALSFCANTALAQSECREPPAVLPHVNWSPHAQASPEELYRRAVEALEHWSNHPALLASASDALTRLLATEPTAARGHVELARLAIMAGAASNITLTPSAYDTAHLALRRALELDPESGEAWMLLAELKLYGRESPGGPHGNTKLAEEALQQAERVGARNPRLTLNWADLHARDFEFDLAEQSVMQALASPDLNSHFAGLAYRKLANYYRQQHRPDDASRALEDALEAEPQNPYNRVAYSAFLLEERTDTSGAITAARRALCLYPLAAANRRLAYALYFDWARDNLKRPEPRPDDRATEAFARYPNWRDVMSYAAEHEKLLPLVEVLVRIGAPVDEADPHDDQSALFKAVIDGRVDDAARLIELGADVNQSIQPHASLLSIAVSNRNVDMIQLLLAHGADVNAQGPAGPALMNATAAGNAELVQLLLAAGANPDLTDDRGETPLALAASQNNAKLVRRLLEAGADPNHEFPPGETIIETTRRLGFPEMATLLENWVNEGGSNESRK